MHRRMRQGAARRGEALRPRHRRNLPVVHPEPVPGPRGPGATRPGRLLARADRSLRGRETVPGRTGPGRPDRDDGQVVGSKPTSFGTVWNETFTRHLLVDTFQDITPRQYGMLGLLVGPTRSVTIATDPDQSICMEQGARRDLVERFWEDHRRDPNRASIHWLLSNHRGSETLSQVAATLVDRLEALGGNRLTAGPSGGPKPVLLEIEGPPQLMYHVVLDIAQEMGDPGYILKPMDPPAWAGAYAWEDIAVIFPRGNSIPEMLGGLFSTADPLPDAGRHRPGAGRRRPPHRRSPDLRPEPLGPERIFRSGRHRCPERPQWPGFQGQPPDTGHLQGPGHRPGPGRGASGHSDERTQRPPPGPELPGQRRSQPGRDDRGTGGRASGPVPKGPRACLSTQGATRGGPPRNRRWRGC